MPIARRLSRLQVRLRSSGVRLLVEHVLIRHVPAERLTPDLVRWVEQPKQI